MSALICGERPNVKEEKRGTERTRGRQTEKGREVVQMSVNGNGSDAGGGGVWMREPVNIIVML